MEKIIFIDRDGVINRDPGGWTRYSYVTRWEDFHFLQGALDALKRLKEAGYKVYLVSNQAGVGKGYFTEADLAAINDKMLERINEAGGAIEELLYCTHTDEDNCDCRKPRSGLIERALRGKAIEAGKVYIVGDSYRDIEAGKRIGLKTILVLSGKTDAEKARTFGTPPDYIKKDLSEAVDLILKGRE